MQKVTDKYGRQFKTLRVSLLSRCNLSCAYCTMGEDVVNENNKGQGLMSPQVLITTIKKLHEITHFDTVRLTGGEPLLYPHLLEVIKELASIGISGIKLTTNGL